MHKEQIQFLLAVRSVFPYFFRGSSVLEIGSYNVNGSIRPMFVAPKRYVGVDLVAGPGVDEVCKGEDYKSSETFDIVVSTECFEHTPNFLDIFRNMIDHCRYTGAVIFTCATAGRQEHGTTRTSPENSPGTVKTGNEYYRNVTAEDFPVGLLQRAFHSYCFFINDQSHDLYFIGIMQKDSPLIYKLFVDVAVKSGARVAQ